MASLLEKLYSWIQSVDLPDYCCNIACRKEHNKSICDKCKRIYYIPEPNKNKK